MNMPRKRSAQIVVSEFREQGQRSHQEDVLQKQVFFDRFHLFVVCDGHGGSDACAVFTSEAMIRNVESELQTARTQQKLSSVRLAFLLKRALAKTVSQWDEYSWGPGIRDVKCETTRKQFFESADHRQSLTRCQRQSGSTVSAMLLDIKSTPGRAGFAYLGDSRFGVLKDRSASFFVSRDHVPLPHSRFRTAFPSTFVDKGRLNGILAMTHCVGDNTRDLYGSVQREPGSFSCTFHRALTVCIATDGFWEIFANAQENLDYLSKGGQASGFVEQARGAFVDNASGFCVSVTVPNFVEDNDLGDPEASDVFLTTTIRSPENKEPGQTHRWRPGRESELIGACLSDDTSSRTSKTAGQLLLPPGSH